MEADHGAAQPAEQEKSFPLAGIPNVALDFYSIAGHNAEQIRAAITAMGLKDQADGKPVDALSRTAFSWRWKESGGEHCVPVEPTVTFAATVTLPRLIDQGRLPVGLKVRWQRYVEALEIHEAGHVRSAYHLVDAIRQRILASSCADADAAVNAITAQFYEQQALYDRATDHGRKQGAIFP